MMLKMERIFVGLPLIVLITFINISSESGYAFLGKQKFIATVYEGLQPEQNASFIFSPISLLIVLSIFMNIIEDYREPKRQMLDVIGAENQKQFKDAIHDILLNFRISEPATKLEIVNKMFLNDNYTYTKDLLKGTMDTINTEIEINNSTDEGENVKKMNQWVENKTEATLKNYFDLSEFEDGHPIMLPLNTVYFRSEWKIPFKKIEKKKPFYFKGKEHFDVDMMCATGNFNYGFDNETNVTFLEIEYYKPKKYRRQVITMTIILPNATNGLSLPRIENSSEILQKMLEWKNYTSRRVQVEIPIFTIDHKIDLGNALEIYDFMIRDVTYYFLQRNSTNITGMAIGNVNQKISFSVEDGGVGNVTAANTTFIANRPFIYYLKYKGIIFFIGRHQPVKK